MPKHTGYTQVDQALQELDSSELSRLGKKGAKSRQAKRYLKIKIWLAGAEETARQANLDVCPIED